jgi:hypothetical protein
LREKKERERRKTIERVGRLKNDISPQMENNDRFIGMDIYNIYGEPVGRYSMWQRAVLCGFDEYGSAMFRFDFEVHPRINSFPLVCINFFEN